MNFAVIKYAVEAPLALISLNRPDKLNAINAEMVAELNRALDAAEADEQVRVILLSGEGRAFSAGFDLESSDFAGGEEAVRAELQADFDIIMRFWNSPKPTVAAVHKYCLGSAMEMAVACDITVAAVGCRFGAPEVRFGSGIVALLLPWFCGPKRAKELLLTGNDRVSAKQAEAWGLINHVVPEQKLHDKARGLALQMARNDKLAVRMTKQAINRSCAIAGMHQALREALEIDVHIESTETEKSRQFNEILKKQGVKEALAWRDADLTEKQVKND